MEQCPECKGLKGKYQNPTYGYTQYPQSPQSPIWVSCITCSGRGFLDINQYKAYQKFKKPWAAI